MITKAGNIDIDKVEAIALDDRHLELKKPIPPNIGKRFLIQILFPKDERSILLKQLERAYLDMTEVEKNDEIKLAEQGLLGQPRFDIQFPDEKEDKWWE